MSEQTRQQIQLASAVVVCAFLLVGVSACAGEHRGSPGADAPSVHSAGDLARDDDATWHRRTVVDADYNSFGINRGSAPEPLGVSFSDTFLTQSDIRYSMPADSGPIDEDDDDGSNMILLTATQYGHLPVDVKVFDRRPVLLGQDWRDVAEFSMTADVGTTVSGWEADYGDLEVPLTAGLVYRVRYAISDMDLADQGSEDVREKYRLDFWPEPPSPAAAITQLSTAGRRWAEAAATPAPSLVVNWFDAGPDGRSKPGWYQRDSTGGWTWLKDTDPPSDPTPDQQPDPVPTIMLTMLPQPTEASTNVRR